MSIRKPGATSFARATSFSRANLEWFQNKLHDVIRPYYFTATHIYNLDEVGLDYTNNYKNLDIIIIMTYIVQTKVTTVQRVPKIVGKKGEH